ncbi:MAG: DNA-processing protein DprA [Actinomycetota bacterium]
MTSSSTAKPVSLLPSDMYAGSRFITPLDPEWPERLRQMEPHDPATGLHVIGKPLTEAVTSVAVVGSRKASAAGLEAAELIARGLAEAGCTVVSGLAVGVDATAHQAALAAGGHTIAVVGAGLDVNYPTRNQRLRRAIQANGSVVSEYELGTPPYASNFPARNRIVVGLCSAVVVVEGTMRSGALITARLALDANRAVFAVPGSFRNVMSEGPNELIRTCQAGLVTSVDHIFEELAPNLVWKDRVERLVPTAPVLEGIELDVLYLMDDTPQTTDRVAYQGGLQSGKVSLALSRLEIRGFVIRQRMGFVISASGARARAAAAAAEGSGAD